MTYYKTICFGVKVFFLEGINLLWNHIYNFYLRGLWGFPRCRVEYKKITKFIGTGGRINTSTRHIVSVNENLVEKWIPLVLTTVCTQRGVLQLFLRSNFFLHFPSPYSARTKPQQGGPSGCKITKPSWSVSVLTVYYSEDKSMVDFSDKIRVSGLNEEYGQGDNLTVFQ